VVGGKRIFRRKRALLSFNLSSEDGQSANGGKEQWSNFQEKLHGAGNFKRPQDLRSKGRWMQALLAKETQVAWVRKKKYRAW